MPDTTIFPSKQGVITGPSGIGSVGAAQTTSGTAVTPTGGVTTAVQFFKSSGRGGGTYRFIRSYLGFDVSGVSSTVQSADLILKSFSSLDDADIRIVNSEAFGNDLSSNIANTDFDDIDTSLAGAFSNEVSSWNSGGSNNTIAINSAGITAINSARTGNGAFIIAIIENDSDYFGVDISGDASFDIGIDFGTGDIKLVVTTAAAGYAHQVLDVPNANMATVKDVGKDSIASVIGV